MFRWLLTLTCAGVMIGCAAPANGDPGNGPDAADAGFLAALRTADIGYSNSDQAIGSARAVCTCLDNGESGFELVNDIKKRNAGFTLDAAAEFAVISAKFYCPQQLDKS